MADGRIGDILEGLEETFDGFLGKLVEFGRIPGVSAEGFDAEELRRSAEFAAAVLEEVGLERIEIWTPDGGGPYVKGEWLKKPGAPTVLLYAHHDVQPPGREELWESPPFAPTERRGRLYGRGVVDDKAGMMMHVAAIDAWMRATGELPLNVKFIVDGEEEIGSPKFERLLQEHHDELSADIVVLNDTANLDTGIPSLTYRLRGQVHVDVEVSALEARLHSGMWGGPVPDPVMGLNKLLSTLVHDDGSIAVEGLLEGVRPPSVWEREQLRSLPYREGAFREQAGMLPGVEIAGRRDASVWEKLWFLPSLTVSALEASPLKGAANQIIESARARIGVRTVPDQDPDKLRETLVRHLHEKAALGLQVRTTPGSSAPWWCGEPKGPAIDAAIESLREGFGAEPVFIGCGASIPFVQPVTRAFPEAPTILMGVEDPACRAHAENESLHLGDWKKSMRSAAILYDKLSRVPREA
jgi:acetylornithine deacetylase/succinyl-diaminopimelate desuccinylase-like protein